MNPILTIDTTHARATGKVCVGETVSVRVTGLTASDIPDITSGVKALRLRIVDVLGKDLARFPMDVEEDIWTVESNVFSCTLDLNTVELREAFQGFPFDAEQDLGFILDSQTDAMQYANGVLTMHQWVAVPEEDPTSMPQWQTTIATLEADLALVEASKLAAQTAQADASTAKTLAQAAAINAQASATRAETAASGMTSGFVKDASVSADAKTLTLTKNNGTQVTFQGGGGSSAWADITGKPTSFPPSTHTHTMSEVDYGDGRNLGEKISGMDTNIGNLASQMSMVPGAINEGISSDVTHAKSISTGGTSTKLTPDDSGNINVSSLFSSDNTSLVNVINSKTQMENAYGPPYAFTQAGDWSLVRNATAGHYQFHDNTGTYDDFGAYIDAAATTRVTDNNIAKACIIYGLRTNAVASVVGYYHVGDPSKVMQKVDYTGGIKLWDAQQSVMWKLTMENGVLTTTPLGNVNTEIS